MFSCAGTALLGLGTGPDVAWYAHETPEVAVGSQWALCKGLEEFVDYYTEATAATPTWNYGHPPAADASD